MLTNHVKKRFSGLFAAAAMLVFVSTMAGCGGGYGLIERNREVGRMFENIEILPDHNYYYSGPDAVPYAIIGIQENYQLKSRLWKRVNLTPELLNMWLNLGMQASIGAPPNGSYIYGPSGEKIGVWYSIFDGGVVKMISGNEVVVHTPSSYPGKSVRPSIERGSLDNPPLSPDKKKEAGLSNILSSAAMAGVD